MQGNLYTGMYELASNFPPSVNTADDSTKIKPFETPACYGVSCTNDGRLSTGSILTGTARAAPTKTVGGNTYSWYYNRLWTGTGGTTLSWGAPYYDDIYFPHGLGKIQLDYTIVTFMPCFQSGMWILTGSGSYFISNARSEGEEDFEPSQFVQELKTSNATYAMTLEGNPVVSHSGGVFMWDGNSIKELTRPVRTSIGNFGAVAITSDYEFKRIIGTNKFVIDTTTGKLFDYGTSGFLFTSRTLAQPGGYEPFTVNSMSIAYELATQTDGTISWESKTEDRDWFAEEDIEIRADQPEKTRVEVPVLNQNRSAHKFAIRLTALSSHIYIKSIYLNVVGLAVEGSAE